MCLETQNYVYFFGFVFLSSTSLTNVDSNFIFWKKEKSLITESSFLISVRVPCFCLFSFLICVLLTSELRRNREWEPEILDEVSCDDSETLD